MATPSLAAAPTAGRPAGRKARATQWSLRLYVAGHTGHSARALQNLTALCAELLPGRHAIEVIDLAKDPHLAAADEIVAIPTLVRVTPKPVRRILGDLSDRARVLAGLDLVEPRP
jgi:circadian clock protein KaiB